MRELIDPRVLAVAAIWSELTGLRVTPPAIDRLAKLSEKSVLLEADDAVLRRAAALCRGGGVGGLAFVDWAHAVRQLMPLSEMPDPESLMASKLASGPKAALSSRVDDVLERSKRITALKLVPPLVLDEARGRIQQRLAAGEFRMGSLARRKPRWRQVPGHSIVAPPIIDADDVEVAVVFILALTHPQAQFAATGASRGRVFAGSLNGFHRHEEQRFYVTGLSDILDTAYGVVQEHRGGQGGRFYVQEDWVECADCRSVVAWIRSAQDDRLRPARHAREDLHRGDAPDGPDGVPTLEHLTALLSGAAINRPTKP